jgi:type VI secretion system secreted protein VgrG
MLVNFFALFAVYIFQMKPGCACITIKKHGDIDIKGKNIKISGSGKINVKASGKVAVKGSKIDNN